MERRILVNYRVDPDTLTAILPPPFRPVLVDGHGVAGVCLIRLGGIRPNRLPAALGVTSENAAHRIAVCWDTADGPVTGVYVPRRDTSSRLAAIAGGRLFPGWQHLARFRVEEHDGHYRVEVDSRDGTVHITVAAHVAELLTPGSVFTNLDAASWFFRCAPLGYAATPIEGVFDGVELGTDGWALQPLHIDEASSSFFDDPTRFPPGATELDSAFLMEGLATTWHPRPKLHATTSLGDTVAR
jgi:hypothetical protein